MSKKDYLLALSLCVAANAFAGNWTQCPATLNQGANPDSNFWSAFCSDPNGCSNDNTLSFAQTSSLRSSQPVSCIYVSTGNKGKSKNMVGYLTLISNPQVVVTNPDSWYDLTDQGGGYECMPSDLTGPCNFMLPS